MGHKYMLLCPECGHTLNTVVDSRVRHDNTVRRRRRCLKCQHKWSTFESTQDANVWSELEVENRVFSILKRLETAEIQAINRIVELRMEMYSLLPRRRPPPTPDETFICPTTG